MAVFTFVARDPLTGKSMAINSLQPATEADRQCFAERQQIAQQRRAARKSASAAPLAGKLTVHRLGAACPCNLLYWDASRMQKGSMPQSLPRALCHLMLQEQSGSQAEWAEERLAEAWAMMDLLALAHGDAVLMQHTKLQNTFMCQPRNMYGRIFGGFLMRCGPPPCMSHTHPGA